MFEPTSRYYALPDAEWTTPQGRVVVYKRRRFLPQGAHLPLLLEVAVAQGERLDLIAERTLGSSEVFWRICDANETLHPLDLIAEPGRVLRVPMPQP